LPQGLAGRTSGYPCDQLQLGEASPANGPVGSGREAAGGTTEATALTGDAHAFGWQPTPAVQDKRRYDLLVMLDQASSEICAAGVKRTHYVLMTTAEKMLDKSRPIL